MGRLEAGHAVLQVPHKRTERIDHPEHCGATTEGEYSLEIFMNEILFLF